LFTLIPDSDIVSFS